MPLARKARIGFIGAGWWATANHIPILAARDDVELTGVCRLGQDELQKIRDHFGFAYATEDFRELLTHCELDGVVISSPHGLHYEHARGALEKGLHVLCEKPLTTRADHARELVRLADERQLHLVVPYGWHYKPFIQHAKTLLDSASIGNIEHVMCHMSSPVRALLSGKSVQMDARSGQAGESMFQPDATTWADPRVSGGGYAHAQMSHALGMLMWISGLRAKQAFCMMSAPGAKVDLYDAITVRFTNGALGSISGAGTLPSDGKVQVDIRIFGTEGTLFLDLERARLEVHRHDGYRFADPLATDAGTYDCNGPPHNFADLVLGKTTTNFAPGEAAMRSVELIDAAYRSSLSGAVENAAPC